MIDVKVFESAAAALPAVFREQPPQCGMVLGSGWSAVLQRGNVLAQVTYGEIPGLGASTVVGHSGELLLFERHGVRVAAFMGRRHWY